MDLVIALAVIAALLYFALRPQQKKIKTDQLTFDYTDDLHEIKCSIAEAEYMLESIEKMRCKRRACAYIYKGTLMQ